MIFSLDKCYNCLSLTGFLKTVVLIGLHVQEAQSTGWSGIPLLYSPFQYEIWEMYRIFDKDA